MKTKKIILVLFLSLTFTSIAIAGNKLSCSYSSEVGGSGCFFSSMQMYDQLSDVSDGGMYCAPTSAAMGLSALTFGGLNVYTSSWTKSNFIRKSKETRIEKFADLMGTDLEDGTSGSGTKKYKKRQADFPSATSNVDSARYTKLNDSRMRKLIRRGEVDILAFGHYTETCTGTGSSKVCTYERDGGHVVAINGYYYTSGSSKYTTHVFDPWGGVEYERDITKLSDKTTKTGFLGWDLDYRTFGDKTYYMLSSGSYFGIIDFVAGSNTN